MRRFFALLFSTVVLFGLAAQEGHAASVSWSVERVSQTLTVGSVATVEVRLRSDTALPQVQVVVTPSLTGAVTVTPTTFAVAANEDIVLTLQLTVPVAVKGQTIAGTLHLRDALQTNKTYSPPLPIALSVDRSPEEFVRALAKAIRSASDDEVLAVMSPSRLNEESIVGMSREERSSLADFFDSATLLRADGEIRTYQGTDLLPDGSKEQSKFGIGYSEDTGKWYVLFW